MSTSISISGHRPPPGRLVTDRRVRRSQEGYFVLRIIICNETQQTVLSGIIPSVQLTDRPTYNSRKYSSVTGPGEISETSFHKGFDDVSFHKTNQSQSFQGAIFPSVEFDVTVSYRRPEA